MMQKSLRQDETLIAIFQVYMHWKFQNPYVNVWLSRYRTKSLDQSTEIKSMTCRSCLYTGHDSRMQCCRFHQSALWQLFTNIAFITSKSRITICHDSVTIPEIGMPKCPCLDVEE